MKISWVIGLLLMIAPHAYSFDFVTLTKNETDKVYPSFSFYNKYPDLTSWMGIKCKHGEPVVYFGFNETPIIQNRDIKNYYSFTQAEVTVNGKPHPISLFRDEGSNFMITPDSEHFMKTTDTDVILKINLFGNGDYYFEYDTSSINKNVCG